MRILVVTPTYNEKENIEKFIDTVLAKDDRIEMLIVDDGSPDGTGKIVDGIIEGNKRVHAIHREGKQGLGTAYLAGFRQAMEMGVDAVIQMDADFSHNPDYLPAMIDKLAEADVVIGSRYLNGTISVVNWPLSRLLLSYFANIYARWVVGVPAYDVTGGFKAMRIEALRGVDLDRVTSNGYSFQIEMNRMFHVRGFKIAEVPIIFADREGGVSKMSKGIILEALYKVWAFRLRKY